MSSSFSHVFTMIIPMALTDCRKRSYRTCICNTPGKKHSATEAYIQEHRRKNIFSIRTQYLLSHAASPFPHRCSPRLASALSLSTVPEQTVQNPKEVAAAMVTVSKYETRLGRQWKRRRWENTGGRQTLYPLELCQV